MSIVLGFVLFVLAMMASAQGRSVSFRWDVKRKLNYNNKVVITINGKTPGPIIQAEQGDTILVKVTNRLAKESIAIDWRGIQQVGSETPSCGGANGPISAGETCTYQFVADQAGKYLYQSEFQMQKEAGLYGLIVVLP